MVKKVVDIKANSAFRPRSSSKTMDQNYIQGKWLANSTIVKSQGNAMQDPQIEEPKVRGTKSLSGPQHSKFSEKAYKEKKKKQCWRDQERQKGSTTATEINTAQTGEPHQKKKKKHLNKAPCNTG